MDAACGLLGNLLSSERLQISEEMLRDADSTKEALLTAAGDMFWKLLDKLDAAAETLHIDLFSSTGICSLKRPHVFLLSLSRASIRLLPWLLMGMLRGA